MWKQIKLNVIQWLMGGVVHPYSIRISHPRHWAGARPLVSVHTYVGQLSGAITWALNQSKYSGHYCEIYTSEGRLVWTVK